MYAVLIATRNKGNTTTVEPDIRIWPRMPWDVRSVQCDERCSKCWLQFLIPIFYRRRKNVKGYTYMRTTSTPTIPSLCNYLLSRKSYIDYDMGKKTALDIQNHHMPSFASERRWGNERLP